MTSSCSILSGIRFATSTMVWYSFLDQGSQKPARSASVHNSPYLARWNLGKPVAFFRPILKRLTISQEALWIFKLQKLSTNMNPFPKPLNLFQGLTQINILTMPQQEIFRRKLLRFIRYRL
jgi:hypothetical protein